MILIGMYVCTWRAVDGVVEDAERKPGIRTVSLLMLRICTVKYTRSSPARSNAAILTEAQRKSYMPERRPNKMLH